ncbi:methyltransferase domain-containing protein [Oscillatoria sp. FACHB-1407]|uniref:class I SAM-dependent methyltransferase n=1 Tax=Oscillatoria sp. FACHB-1407 TaxID=2692847 RepID=UPI00168883CD|nr:class I SAM-dependent methyltransferase [Oscillatoria sp. FACHB-1407]MBD2464227.1 methyltransferase domain-containing protein [Oscillatoria sp. FACHB-1407]
MSLTTPVAFLIFNRPELTARVFQAIANAKPKKLLVVADGPRFPEEAEKCRKAREVINQVDWDCEVLTNFSEHNLGCKRRVSSGINWVFSEVEEAILLEDDCLPVPSFFSYCQALLERYRNDSRIMHISGNNFQFGIERTKYSYYFSRYPHIWGWATWRRAWQHYDVDMQGWLDFKEAGLISSMFEHPQEQILWTQLLDQAYRGEVDTWDYPWGYTVWSQTGLSILPRVNLVTNIGFGADATHTTPGSNNPLANLPTEDLWELEHPPYVAMNREADLYTYEKVFGGKVEQGDRQQIIDLKAQLDQKEKQLQELNKVKNRLRRVREQLEEAQGTIVAMESSKFWKLRQKWMGLKDLIKQPLKKLEGLSKPEISVREQGKLLARQQGYQPKQSVVSPLTGSNQVKLIEVFPASQLINDWKNGFRIDITSELHGHPEICLYECLETGLKFFLPSDTTGSDKLYEQLCQLSWYYMPDKWEYQVALEDLKGYQNVIEIGSGYGYFIQQCKEAGLQARGIELNESAVKAAQKQNLPIERVDLKDLVGQYSESFDAVCSFQVLEHVSNPKDFLDWSIQLLKKGGKLVLCVPNSESFLKHEYCLLDMPPHHMFQWSKKSFKALEKIFPIKLEKVKLEPLASYHVMGYLTSYRDYYRSVSPVGKLLFNRHTLSLYQKALNTGLRQFVTGQSLYVEFRKL